MVFNATFNNISVYIVSVSFIGGENRSTRRKPPTNVTDKNLSHNVVRVHLAMTGVRTLNLSGGRHCLHK
jgi:hypothetical protein